MIDTKEQKEKISSEILQFASFKIGSDKYAIDIMKIKEITRFCPIKRVPKSPPFVDGVINLRGRIIPIMDMRKRLDVEVTPAGKKTRIFVVIMLNRVAGLLVDEATEVIRIPLTQIKPAPGFAKAVDAQFFEGVFEKNGELILIFNIDKILTGQEITSLMEMKAPGS
ncbi:MAG TPA: chemotaxis protein CheW [bacterium]